jgi:hypothetical protein
MSSLSGAPPLGGARKPVAQPQRLDLDRPVSPHHDDPDEDDLFPPSYGARPTSGHRSDSSAGKQSGDKKDRKKDKKDKTKKDKPKKDDKAPSSKPPLAKPAGAPVATTTSATENDEGGYSEDFDEGDMLSVIDRPPLPSSNLNVSATLQAQQQQEAAAALQRQQEHLQRMEAEMQARLKAVQDAEAAQKRRQQEEADRKMREWNQQEEQRRRQETAEAVARPLSAPAYSSTPTKATVGAATVQRRPSADVSPANSLAASREGPLAGLQQMAAEPQLNQQLLALLQTAMQQQQQQQQQQPRSTADVAAADAAGGADDRSERGSVEGPADKAGERERRRRRERERARDQRKAHDEGAAHTVSSLVQRSA